MKIPTIIALSATANEIYLKHKDAEEEWDFSSSFVAEHSILDSGWDFHWVSTNVAGVVSQLERNGAVRDAGCLTQLGSFCFMSEAILTAYFPHPEKCPLFIAHLFLKQQLLDSCLAVIKGKAI